MDWSLRAAKGGEAISSNQYEITSLTSFARNDTAQENSPITSLKKISLAIEKFFVIINICLYVLRYYAY